MQLQYIEIVLYHHTSEEDKFPLRKNGHIKLLYWNMQLETENA